jgi:hypothetical protein
VLRGPRVVYDAMQNRWDDGPGKMIQQACEAVAPFGCESVNLRVRAPLVEADPTLYAELLDRARGRSVDNQAATAKQFLLWENLRFRSLPEVKIQRLLKDAASCSFRYVWHESIKVRAARIASPIF